MALIVDKKDKVATVTIDRPPVNAITLAIYEEIAETFEASANWQDINCIVFTAAGSKAFCAGLDLNEFLAAKVEDDPARAKIIRRCFSAVRHAAVPVIGAINGPALGAGCVLASVCDVRIASENATFGMPEINVGRCGGAAHMARHLPQGLLRKMYFTGRPIDAREAWRVGFVQDVVPFDDLARTAQELAALIGSKAPIGLRMAKDALNKVEFMQTEEGYELEQSYSTKLMATEDAREATRAVVEKRAPVWVGR
ncbi:enoyl-CoA hydratase-related protein [Methylocella sp. CPCC 101449]|jgi:enoyl-CoA hydratase|uniref:enoyl-CoA hydratase-related protein n=1 Tax=Methylocella sp. CPCC 101449 TaxID=2987531 RepID=UPI00288F0FB7|nr:enoyl-CoA hydratase-related protein [Methylocella sp. CPCC 101449]MDT2019395.1 enoyl-CoA hydratase-related protein [Methylocella sp. CPCC 101449]HEV2573207.1 enoyl-CoA hydratase-related protein [Beijerinckiaceae bacterium]